jgi:hypothetical protein
MTLRTIGYCVTCLFLLAACSSDSGPDVASNGQTGGKAGSSSTGGSKNGSGGASSTGGAPGSGGYDTTLAAQCGIDYTGDDCKGCLAASCCSAVEGCFADTACMAAFSTYQACIKEPGQVDFAGCLGDFTVYTKSDAGTKHQGAAACIIASCQLCGGVSAL